MVFESVLSNEISVIVDLFVIEMYRKYVASSSVAIRLIREVPSVLFRLNHSYLYGYLIFSNLIKI